VELVVGDGPDPSMDLLLVPADVGDSLDAVAERWFTRFSEVGRVVAPGTALQAGVLETLRLDGQGLKRFPLHVTPGRHALLTQHRPEEFSARLEGAPAFAAVREFAGAHEHDETVTSIGLRHEGEVDEQRLNAWLGSLLRERGADLFRMKGLLAIAGQPERFVFQGVHMLFDGRADKPWGAAARSCELVFIGRNLDREALEAGFRACHVR
jgi:G3E family GTPase